MQIVILCGGKATRLYPLSKRIPKSIIKINGKPFLEYQLELLKKNGIFDMIFCTGHKGEQIEKYFGDGGRFGVKIRYSREKEKLLGTGGALKKAESLLDEIFFVTYGDSYLPFNFKKSIDYFDKFDKLGLMTVFKNCGKYEPSNVEVKENLVKSYSKKRKTKKMKYIDYGVSIFRKKALEFLAKNQVYDLAKLHQILIRKRQLLAFESKIRFYTIGSFRELEEFENYIKKHNY
jgi:NDP-sugar pyrophosphorylase family protein